MDRLGLGTLRSSRLEKRTAEVYGCGQSSSVPAGVVNVSRLAKIRHVVAHVFWVLNRSAAKHDANTGAGSGVTELGVVIAPPSAIPAALVGHCFCSQSAQLKSARV
jgi:hypothetical protein